jgi:hypothetical protein
VGDAVPRAATAAAAPATGAVPAARRQAIVAAWLARALPGEAASAGRLWGRDASPFRNPVGHAFAEALPVLLDQLLGPMEAGAIAAALDRIVRIRAVQDVPPGEALSVIVALRALLAREPRAGTDGAALDVAEARLDDLLLRAFDVYVRCREEMWAIRARDTRRRVEVLERMYGRGERLA